MKVKLSELPYDVRKEIPISIRTLKDEYDLDELPMEVRTLVSNYLASESKIPDLSLVLDYVPFVSSDGDFAKIKDVSSMIVEYLRVFLLTPLGSYPFDPEFGSRLKDYLHTLDTTLRDTLINDEVNRIVKVLSTMTGVPITVKKITVTPTGMGSHTEVNAEINLKIHAMHKKIKVVYY